VTEAVEEERHRGGLGACYRPDDAWDEAFEGIDSPRRLYADLLEELASVDLRALAADVAAHLRDRGVSFGDSGRGREAEFRLDPVPRLIDRAEWAELERGLVQRARALAAFVADVYAERAILAAGRLPARVVESAEHFEPWLLGVPVPVAGYVAGLDLVRGDDGVLRVVEDNVRTPSGIAYLLAARDAVDAHLPARPPDSRRDPGVAYELLAAALRAAAPDGADDPHVVILSDGPSNSAWWEHRQIAQGTGLPLVGPDDLLVRRDRLHHRVEGGHTKPVDVVYRRTDVDRLRDAHGRPTWIADLLLAPVRRGGLTVVNPLGFGVADDKLVHAYVEEMVRFYLDEEPLLESVPTYDLGDAEVREAVLPRLDELVVKPRSGLGGHEVVICSRASQDDRRLIARRVAERPEAWVAQEQVTLSTHPTICEGRLEPRHVDLRPYVIGAGADANAVPGALTRVAFEAGSLVVNSSQNGGGKDTWVLTRGAQADR